MSCTSKATFGFPGDPPEKAFVCRKHKKAEFHSLYKSEFGYAAEAVMPALMHIHKAGAGPPTLSVEGKKLSVKERQARSKDYSRGEFQGNFQMVHMTPCLAMPDEFGGEQVNRDYEIERLTSENTKLVTENVMLKERLLEAARENLRLTQECAVATEKFNLLHSIFSGGHISNPVHVLGTQSAQTHVESLRDSTSGSIGAPQPNLFSPVPNVPQQPTFFSAGAQANANVPPTHPHQYEFNQWRQQF